MSERAALAEASFERMAEAKGDITRAVIERYYRMLPDARASFEHHGLGNTAELEGRMVTETAFLLIKWAENPQVAKVEQGTTIVHHQDTLVVGPHWYMGLIDAVLGELFDTIPADAGNERQLWLQIRREIAEFVESVRCEFWRKDESGPLSEFVPFPEKPGMEAQ